MTDRQVKQLAHCGAAIAISVVLILILAGITI